VIKTAMKKTCYITRRSFLARCAATAAATGLPLWFVKEQLAGAAEAEASKPKLPGPNDRPGIALVGCGGQGSGDARNASNYGEVIAVCDVDDHSARGDRKSVV
jgi:hypothetical protein